MSTTEEDDAAAVPPQIAAAAAAAPEPASELSYPPEFTARRLLVFLGIVVGYTTFYLTRGSLTYSAPVLLADKSLGLTLTDIGAMTSIFPMAYGVSKFVSGVVASSVSSRILLGVGLAATAAVCIAFGFSSSLPLFCVLWGLNGMLQGVGAPACASILTRWFASKERGTYWGMWNIAHNLGGFLAPVIVGGCAKAFGWRFGMWAPGAIGLAVAFFVLGAVRDRPQDCGFAAVDAAPPLKTPEVTAAAAPAEGAKAEGAKAVAAEASGDGMMAALKSVLKLPSIWALAFTYFFVYVVRQGVTSWLVFYLMAEKGAADAGAAALTVSGLELGGLAGSTVAGLLSDMAIRRATARGDKGGNVGRRIKVVMLYTAGMAAMLLALQAVPASAKALQWIVIAGLGFTIYGPQMLIGLSGAELVAPAAVGASQGILGWIAYLGAANAGIPLSFIVQKMGWGGFFSALLGACCVAMVLLSTVANAPSYLQRREKEAPAPAAA
ncbi:MAG: hexose-phosphate transporter, major isoform [Monoraphidium minutum]|nr:MAG: hexose-phosphate transporter, major isoform [Monoraphidium minutum]